MNIHAFAESGFAGSLVSVEVDIRRGIPSLEIVGLPDGAVKESRDRVRVAIRRSGYDFPLERILVNLSPAGLRKEGASYDLPIALGILAASGQINTVGPQDLLCAGELRLDGVVQPVAGILPAVAAGLESGVKTFIVPRPNAAEAAAISGGRILALSHLKELPRLLEPADNRMPASGETGPEDTGSLESGTDTTPGRVTVDTNRRPAMMPVDTAKPPAGQEMADIRGQEVLKRALEIAAAGGHHMLIFGPPGSGKTMGARALEGLLPDLDGGSALDVTRIWSRAGKVSGGTGLMCRPPFREPHHSASAEGLIGGGGGTRPGEVSLAHRGVLFLDETPEFGTRVLQSLREPLESGRVDIARAGRTWWFPADFQLVMAMNACPCGNLGREDAPCLCTPPEIHRHWRRLGGALLDRVDIRVPVRPLESTMLLEEPGESTEKVAFRVLGARRIQEDRYRCDNWRLNAGIPPGQVNRSIPLPAGLSRLFTDAVRTMGLSSRAAHGVLRVTRTIADLAEHDIPGEYDLLEALQHRRYGDRDLFWTVI